LPCQQGENRRCRSELIASQGAAGAAVAEARARSYFTGFVNNSDTVPETSDALQTLGRATRVVALTPAAVGEAKFDVLVLVQPR
jgi:hypothetical protein